MNKTEARYAQLLDQQIHLRQIVWWKFHPLKLRLANPACWYEIDFISLTATMEVEFTEVKGSFAREDAIIKFKVASELFPHFRFKMAKLIKGEWEIKTIEAGRWV